MFLLTGQDKMLGKWLVDQIPHVESVEMIEPFKAIGVMSGPSREDELWGVVAFHSYVPQYRTCQISMAAANPRWASKATIRALLSVPFLQYNCHKVWTATPHMNERVIAFNERLGFKKEGVLKDQYGPKIHAVICRLLKPRFYELYIPREWRQAA